MTCYPGIASLVDGRVVPSVQRNGGDNAVVVLF